ncbi:MAG: AEC family transporter [Clostridia bacterium]|nr:AEC family transporter [Clostridia bacterium]
MDGFLSTLNQTAFLFAFIVIGYILGKFKIIPDNSATVLSKLENNLFVPALVMGTFINNFTVNKIGQAGKVFGISFIMILIMMPVATFTSKLITKDKYEQNIFTYGLAFANFGFMGNAVVKALFPEELFLNYIIFTLPLWIMIYLWGVPALLIGGSGEKRSFSESLKSFLNPMFIAMIIGMIIGLAPIPWNEESFIARVITVSGDCMSPVAMLLTGITVSSIDMKKTFMDGKIYAATFIRLIIIPLVFLGLAKFIPFDETVFICAVCALSMPLGLNTVVIPSAYGKDTSKAAGMAVVSHLLSCLTIPLIFMLVNKWFGM